MEVTHAEMLKQTAAAEEFRQASIYAHSLLEASIDPLVTINTEGKITDVNEATVKVTGLARDTLIGTNFASYFTEPEKAREVYCQVFATGSVVDYPLTIRHTDNKLTNVLYNASLYTDADRKALGVFAATSDVSGQKKVLKLTKAIEKLAAVNSDLEAFSYSVSHDLRAPLRAVDGFSRILIEEYGEKLGEEGRRLLKVVRDNTVKMSRMIDDILAFSRAGRGELAMSPVNMEALVRAAIKDLETSTAGRKVTFEVGALPQAPGDASTIRHVWTNLLDNAVKFTALKVEAIIEIGATGERGEIVYFVRDNGAGFDMQYANKLFGVFQRLHGAEFAGTGIGLAIVKRIVTRHGGRVWAEGKPNEGATFYFSLPNKESVHG